MSRVRVFLMCLLMLAVPLQGYAAASMALCAAPQAQEQAAMAHDMPATHEMHAMAHGMAADVQPHDAGAMDSHEAHSAHGAASQHAASDSPHQCASCAACHAVALTGVTLIVPSHLLPQADIAEPASALASRAPRVHYKPPRA